jgi:hypothetical protein
MISCSSQIDQLEKQFRTETFIDLTQLEAYKRKFMRLCDAMRTEREPQLIFILESIEQEIQEGFYDLVMSEQCNQLESDWSRLKQRLNQNRVTIDRGIVRLSQFDKDVAKLRHRIEHKSAQNEYAQLNDESTIILFNDYNTSQLMNNTTLLSNRDECGDFEDEKSTLKQITNLKNDLDSLRSFWLNNCHSISISSESGNTNETANDSHLRQMLKANMCQTFDELSNDLDRIELKNRLKMENNFSQLKQSYSTRIHELNSLLENEVSFLSHGKVVTHKQYAKSIDALREILARLDEAKLEMKQVLTKFELEFENTANSLVASSTDALYNSSENNRGTQIKKVLCLAKDKIGKYDLNGLLDDSSLKQSILTNLTNKNLELRAKQLVVEAETETNELFCKYDSLHESLTSRLDKTRMSIVNDMENLDLIINDDNLLRKPNLFEDILDDMLNNKNLFEDFETVVKSLGKIFFLQN